MFNYESNSLSSFSSQTQNNNHINENKISEIREERNLIESNESKITEKTLSQITTSDKEFLKHIGGSQSYISYLFLDVMIKLIKNNAGKYEKKEIEQFEMSSLDYIQSKYPRELEQNIQISNLYNILNCPLLEKASTYINFFTQDSFLPKMIKEYFKEKQFFKIFQIRFFIFRLTRALNHWKIEESEKLPQYLYMECKLSKVEIESWRTLNSPVMLNGFVSTGTSKLKTENFNSIEPNLTTVIFKFATNPSFKFNLHKLESCKGEELYIINLNSFIETKNFSFDEKLQVHLIECEFIDLAHFLSSIPKEQMEYQEIIERILQKPYDLEELFLIEVLITLKMYDTSLELLQALDSDQSNSKSFDVLQHLFGILYKSKGEYARAIEFFEVARLVREEKFGLNNLETFDTYLNLALSYSETGELIKAIDLFKKAENILKMVLIGNNHLQFALLYNNMGLIHQRISDYTQAIYYFEKELEIRREIKSHNLPEISQNLNNLGQIYLQLGGNDKALQYYFQALEVAEKSQKETDPSTATVYNNIGLGFLRKGDHKMACEYVEKGLKMREQQLGLTHNETISSYYNLGVIYLEMGKLDKALQLFEKTIENMIKLYGENHLETANCYNSIGIVHYKRKDNDMAIYYLEKDYQIKSALIKDFLNPTFFDTCQALGDIYIGLKMNDKAKEMLQICLRIYININGKDHIDNAILIKKLAVLFINTQEYKLALEHLEWELNLQTSSKGPDCKEAAENYNLMAIVYSALKEYENAILYHQKALFILYKKEAENQVDIAKNLNNLAIVYKNMTRYDLALSNIKKSLAIREKLFAPNHPDNDIYKNNLTLIVNEYRQALKTFEYYDEKFNIISIVKSLLAPLMMGKIKNESKMFK
jgi:tetratricopeptide (TPR) repeat protein